MASHFRKPVATPPPPILLITDHTTTPPITTSYLCGNNEIDFRGAYSTIKSLLRHQTCPHQPNQYAWPCVPCETAFTTKYWSCAATLLDYFADFYATDASLMQSLWFYLLDIWQESAHHLPYETVLEETVEHSEAVWGVERAKAFEKAVRDTITLFEVTIWGRRKESDTGDQVIFDPSGEAMCPVGEYETGPWVSGVKPWAQFLGNGGVGVAPPYRAPPPPTRSNSKGNGEQGDDTAKDEQTIRYIPLPGIAIVEAHSARARVLASSLFAKQDPDLLTTSLAAFDAHTVALPSARNQSHTYVSCVTGRETTYSLANGAPPVMRYEGLGDAQLDLACPPGEWSLMDECVASCRGVAVFVPVSGGDGQEEEDEDMVDSEDEEVPFDLWTVVEKKVERGRRHVLELGSIFETWCGVDEF